jgi:hypothetical protein
VNAQSRIKDQGDDATATSASVLLFGTSFDEWDRVAVQLSGCRCQNGCAQTTCPCAVRSGSPYTSGGLLRAEYLPLESSGAALER